MAKVKYVGRSDQRILTAADLKTVDIDGFSKTVFTPGVEVEVSDEVARVLVERPEIFGRDFRTVDERGDQEPRTAEQREAGEGEVEVNPNENEKGTVTARTTRGAKSS